MGEAFTMLTIKPGPNVAPYHNRQVVVLRRDDWARWLDPEAAEHLLESRPEAPALTLAMAGSS